MIMKLIKWNPIFLKMFKRVSLFFALEYKYERISIDIKEHDFHAILVY